MDSYKASEYDHHNDTKLSLPTSTQPSHLGVEQKWKLDFTHSNTILWYKVSQINNFERECFLGVLFEVNWENCFKIDTYLHISQRFLHNPLSYDLAPIYENRVFSICFTICEKTEITE